MVFVCGCRTGVIAVPLSLARGSGGWDALDEGLGDGKWGLPSHVPPIWFGASMGFKPAPASMPPIIHPPTVSANGHGGGWYLSLELSGFSRPRGLHLRQGLEVGRFSFIHTIGLNWLLLGCCSQRVIRSCGWSELDWR